MYFFRVKGKQFVDMRGDFVLSHNKDLVIARGKSIGPRAVKNGNYAVGLPQMGFRAKWAVTWAAIGFIWGKSQALQPEDQ